MLFHFVIHDYSTALCLAVKKEVLSHSHDVLLQRTISYCWGINPVRFPDNFLHLVVFCFMKYTITCLSRPDKVPIAFLQPKKEFLTV